jgi:hypothetical protein
MSLPAATIEIKVSLAANPNTGITKGSPVSLTATVTERKPFPSPKLTFGENLRYTFTAQRTWPCGDAAQTIAQNSPNATVNWTPPKAGLYTFRVNVTNFEKLPNPPLKSAPLAEATIGNYRVGPPAGFSHQVSFSMSPASGTATAPANVTVTIGISNPGSHRYPFKVYLGGTCSGEFPASPSCSISNVAANSYLAQAEVNEVDPGTCDWLATIGTHDYNYYVVNR